MLCGACGDEGTGQEPEQPSNNLPLEDYDPVAAGQLRLTLKQSPLILGERVWLSYENDCEGALGNYGGCSGPRSFSLVAVTLSAQGVLAQRPTNSPLYSPRWLMELDAVGVGEVTIRAQLRYTDRNRHERTVELSQTARVVRPPTTLQITCQTPTPLGPDDTPAMTAGAPLGALLTFLVQGTASDAQRLDITPYLLSDPAQRQRLRFTTTTAETIAGLTRLATIMDTNGWPHDQPLTLGGPTAEDQRTPALLTPDDFTSFVMLKLGSEHIPQPLHHDVPVCHNTFADPRLTLTVLEGPCKVGPHGALVRFTSPGECVVALDYDSGRISQLHTLTFEQSG